MKLNPLLPAYDNVLADQINQSNFPNAPSGLLNPTEDGSIPRRRIKDAKQARAMLDWHLALDALRSETRAAVRGMLDGNKPFSSKQLAENGMADGTNVNFRLAQDYLRGSMLPLINVLLGSPRLASIEFEDEDDMPADAAFNIGALTPNLLRDWQSICEEEFDDLLRVRWKDFSYFVLKSTEERQIWGLGPWIFPFEDDWRPRAIEAGAVLTTKASPSFVNGLEWFAVSDKISASHLFSKIKNKAAAEAQGWHYDTCLKVMAMQKSGTRQTTWTLAEQIEKNFLRNDYFWWDDTSDIIYYHMYSLEFEGENEDQPAIHYYLLPNVPAKNKAGEYDFMCEKVLSLEELAQVLVPNFENIGSGDWHSVRGDLFNAHPQLEALNMFLCHLLDAARIGGSLKVQYGSQTAQVSSPMVTGAGVTHIPFGLNVVLDQVAPQLQQGPMQVVAFLKNQLQAGFTRLIKTEDKGKGENYQSAAAKSQDNLREAQDQIPFVTELISSYSSLYAEIWRRITSKKIRKTDKLAKQLVKRLIRRGVPEEILDKPAIVNCMGSANMATAPLQLATMQQLSSLLGRSELNSDNVLKGMITVLTGNHRNMKQYFVDPQDRNAPTADSQYADLENHILEDGKPLTVSPSNNHVVHMNVHLQAMASALQSVAQQSQQAPQPGQDPMQIIKSVIDLLSVGIQHCQSHAQWGTQNPTTKPAVESLLSRVQTLENHLKHLQKVFNQMQKAAFQKQALEQQQAQAGGQGGQMDPKLQAQIQLADLQVQEGKLRLETMVQQAQLDDGRKVREHELKMQELNAKVMLTLAQGKAANAQGMQVPAQPEMTSQ